MENINAQTKEAFQDGKYTDIDAGYQIIVDPKGSLPSFTIISSNIIFESCTLRESLCSADTLKFGLCEASVFEFEYFGYDSILGREINVLYLKTYEPSGRFEAMQLGKFTVKKCSLQQSTGIYKVVAYDMLNSDFLDDDVSDRVRKIVGSKGAYVCEIVDKLIGDKMVNKEAIETTHARGSTEKIVNIPLYDSAGTKLNESLWVMCYGDLINNPVDKTLYRYWADEIVGQTARATWAGIANNYYTYDGTTLYSLSNYAKRNTANAVYLNGGFEISAGIRENKLFFPFFSSVYEEVYNRTRYSGITWLPVDYYISSTSPSWDYKTWKSEFSRIYKSKGIEAKGGYIPTNPIEDVYIAPHEIESLNKITIREILSSIYECSCLFGTCARFPQIYGKPLMLDGLYPANSLYPNNSLYPSGTSGHLLPNLYENLFADSEVKSFRNLIIAYKDSNGDDQEVSYTINANGNVDYYMRDNWALKTGELPPYKVRDAMLPALQAVTWVDYEANTVGLPYLEIGDAIEIPVGNTTYRTFILSRTLTGIRCLQDNFKCGSVDIF